ncbi:metallopeptidase [Nocardia colli]|uniref:Metallopeptidase n=1 Tax=Nocardia colli TaxID=2545717 RepID=A0A5N0DLV2_9NOCA|nr:metallopeptidase [Nocardia colli]KAA8877440.1 metallopeptidase [Nocardia colli]
MTSRQRLRLGAVTVLALFGAVLAGCDKGVQPAPNATAPSGETVWEVAGSMTANGPNGPRKGVPDAPLTAVNGDGGKYDKLALNAIADLQEYWTAAYPKIFPGTFTPVSVFESWDAKAPKQQAIEFCGESTYHVVNAAYCSLDHTIGWDRGVLLPAVVEKFGEMAVVMVLAHEYGHAIQGQARLAGMRTPTLVLEQQADCLAGVFLRHVAEGASAHFTLNTTDGLNSVLGATVAIRDQDPSDPSNAHGSAFERVTAVQIGYSDGAQGCKSITTQQIAQRRGTLPVSFEPGEEFAQLPVTTESLNSVSQALTKIFPTGRKPRFDYSGVVKNCPNVTATEPVSYCPGTNTIGTEVPALAKRGAPVKGREDPLSAVVNGDYNAFVIFVSRYVLAVQNDRKLGLTGAETAGLRTACLSGVVTTKLSEPGSDPRLSAGDLDEAVSELLSDGLAASDVNGKVVPSGYQRVEAFRTGVLEGEQACLSRYK